MSEQSFRTNSQWMPKGFPHHFDAHIYFNDEQFAEAKRLVVSTGLEPVTSPMSRERATNYAKRPIGKNS